MLTIEQALTADEFHADGCTRTVGPRGGVRTYIMAYRRNGATKTWITRPGHFRVPVKYGMHGYSSITHNEVSHMHAATDCPLRFDS